MTLVGKTDKLILSGLTRRFGSFTAVDSVDLSLSEGEFVSLLGPSGCGKTTTLRMIAGFMPPSGGSISVDGKPLSGPGGVVPPERRGMSMIFQSYAIWPNMTVAENVAFGLTLRRLSRAEVRDRVAKILATVRMGHLSERYPAELSGGQQQRVALARAIVVQPAVLLLDEPLSNLDASLREEMRFEIRRLHDEFRITTVYVTHDQGEAMVTSDRIAVMNEGRIEQVDAPFQLYNRPRTRFVAGFIGRTNLVDAERRGGEVAFGGFVLPAERLHGLPDRDGPFTLSIRPEAIGVTAPGTEDARARLAATIAERAYLGDHWDYLAMVGSLRLRVQAPPRVAFETGSAVTLAVDPSDMVAVA